MQELQQSAGSLVHHPDGTMDRAVLAFTETDSY